MPAVTLTARNILTLKCSNPAAGDNYFDRARGSPKGFVLRVTPRTRAFYLVYRHGDGASKRWLYLGDSESLSLADARQKGHAAREMLRQGFDPRQEEQRHKREHEEAEERRNLEAALQAARPTLSALVSRFIDAHEKKYRPKTIGEYRRIQKAHLERDVLGSLFASDVRRYQLRAFLESIAREAPVMANRVQQLIRAAYAWGIREQLDDALEANPAAGFDVHDERPLPTEDRTLTEAEIRTLWLGVDSTNQEGVRILPTETASLLRLLLLCGLRRTEAALADWRDVNLRAGEWRIPAANRKAAGRRGKTAEQRELIVPLSRTAKAILEELSTTTGPDGPIFGRASHTLRVNPHRFMTRIREAVGIDFALHDLRATCATGAGEAGAPPHIVSLILGHAALPGAAQATALYDRAMRLREVKAALQRWADRLEKLAARQERADIRRLG